MSLLKGTPPSLPPSLPPSSHHPRKKKKKASLCNAAICIYIILPFGWCIFSRSPKLYRHAFYVYEPFVAKWIKPGRAAAQRRRRCSRRPTYRWRNYLFIRLLEDQWSLAAPVAEVRWWMMGTGPDEQRSAATRTRKMQHATFGSELQWEGGCGGGSTFCVFYSTRI